MTDSTPNDTGWQQPASASGAGTSPATPSQAYPPPSSPPAAQPSSGYPAQGYPTQGYSQQGYDQQGYAQGAAGQPQYAPPGYAGQTYPGYPPQGYGLPGAAPGAAGNPLPLIAAIAVPVVLLIGLLVPENEYTLFKGVPGWSIEALISGALVTIGVFLKGTLGRRLLLVGAGGVFAFWTLIVLPAIGRNTSLAVSLATAAAVWLAWPKDDATS